MRGEVYADQQVHIVVFKGRLNTLDFYKSVIFDLVEHSEQTTEQAVRKYDSWDIRARQIYDIICDVLAANS